MYRSWQRNTQASLLWLEDDWTWNWVIGITFLSVAFLRPLNQVEPAFPYR